MGTGGYTPLIHIHGSPWAPNRGDVTLTYCIFNQLTGNLKGRGTYEWQVGQVLWEMRKSLCFLNNRSQHKRRKTTREGDGMPAGAAAGCPRDEHTGQSQRRSRPDTDSIKTGKKESLKCHWRTLTEYLIKSRNQNSSYLSCANGRIMFKKERPIF